MMRTPRRRWGRHEGDGDASKEMGTPRKRWGRHEGDGDATKEMGTPRRRWGCHEGDGDATKEMGTPRRRWGRHEGGQSADWNGRCGVCHTGQSMGFQHSAVEAGLFRSPMVSLLLLNAECWPTTHAVEGFLYPCLRRVTQRGSPDPLEDHRRRAEVVGVATSPHK